MRCQSLPQRAFAALVLLLPLAAGCVKPFGSVSGEVTLDGKPLSTGYITFTPADGKGPIIGGPVANGRFDVQNIPAGSKVVSVQPTVPAPSGEMSSGDAYAKDAKAAKAAAKPISSEVTGNGQALDVAAGPQTFNVTLTSFRR
jgi:hypothetical protein